VLEKELGTAIPGLQTQTLTQPPPQPPGVTS
jgi:hypothetical protein